MYIRVLDIIHKRSSKKKAECQLIDGTFKFKDGPSHSFLLILRHFGQTRNLYGVWVKVLPVQTFSLDHVLLNLKHFHFNLKG